MYYWKTFLAMCLACWLTTLAFIVLIVLGLFGVVHLGTGLWVLIGLFLLGMILGSIVCFYIFDAEIQERREERDNRKCTGGRR